MFVYGFNDNYIHVSHGCIDSPTKNTFNEHFHEKHELFIFISGNVNYNIEGTVYKLKPYDILFIPATKYHFVQPLDDTPYENFIISFSNSFMIEKNKKLFMPPYILNIAEDKRAKDMLERIEFFYANFDKKDFEVACEAVIRELIIYLSYIPRENCAPVEKGLIAEIIAFIEKNIYAELNAQIVANHFSFSKSYIQNQFSQSMGIGLQQYIHYKKICAAKSEIENGMTSCEAAAKYGYNNYPSFYRQYVKVLGCSPSYNKNN